MKQNSKPRKEYTCLVLTFCCNPSQSSLAGSSYTQLDPLKGYIKPYRVSTNSTNTSWGKQQWSKLITLNINLGCLSKIYNDKYKRWLHLWTRFLMKHLLHRFFFFLWQKSPFLRCVHVRSIGPFNGCVFLVQCVQRYLQNIPEILEQYSTSSAYNVLHTKIYSSSDRLLEAV